MKDEIDLLKVLKFNIATRGFAYWIYAIELKKDNPSITIFDIYKELAAKENTTRQNIEGSMRYTRKDSTRSIKKYFDYSGRITNSSVLSLLSMKVGEIDE